LFDGRRYTFKGINGHLDNTVTTGGMMYVELGVKERQNIDLAIAAMQMLTSRRMFSV